MRRILICVFLILFVNSSWAQSIGVWALPKDGQLNENDLKTNNDFINLINKYSIYQISHPLPNSKKKNLNTILEINCNCEVDSLLKDLRNLSSIFTVCEPAPYYDPMYVPNDFNLNNTYNYALNLINAQDAWDITKGDSTVIIAISDLNYYTNHEELINKIDFYDSLNLNGNFAHGTCVAIAAAGDTDNSIGTSSIGFKTKLQLRPANYNALLEASYSGAKVINISWSSGCYPNYFTQSVVDEIYENGTTIVASAGNGVTCGGATNFVYPASHDHVISVSSIGPWNNHERFIGNANSTHQHNNMVDLCAPGYDVLLSPSPGLYLTGNGTSFAAPMVSGLIALMLSVNPCLNPDQIEFILKEAALNLDSINSSYSGLLGAGRIDAYESVLMASTFSTIGVGISQKFDCLDSIEKLIVDLDSNLLNISNYHWNNGLTSYVLNNPDQGEDYSFEIIDTNGCFGIAYFHADSLMPLEVNLSIDQISCFNENDGSANVNINGGNGITSFQWINVNSSNPNLDNLSPGWYSFSVMDEYNCSIIDSFEIYNIVPFSVSLSYVENEYLKYGELVPVIQGGTPPFAFNWNCGTSNPKILIEESGFYEVEIVDSNDCIISSNIFISPLSFPFIKDTNIGSNVLMLNDSVFYPSKGDNLLSPNPVSRGSLCCSKYQFQQLKIYSVSGKIVFELNEFSEGSCFRVDEGLSNGVYYVELLIDGKYYFEKIYIV